MNEYIYIILINYCGENLTIECVNSLLNQDYKKIKIVIVDNNSPDQSGEHLSSLYKDSKSVCVILSKVNNGFSSGNNIGIKYSISQGAKYIMLLNNDTEVKEDFLVNLLSNWDRKSVRAPKINYFSDKREVWYAAGNFNLNKGIVENGDSLKKCRVNFASGCCMLLPVNVIDKVGLLSEDYFMYYEDVDYCLRLAQEGIYIEYIPDSLVYHKVGKTSGGEESKLSIYYNNRNRFIIISKFGLSFRCKIYTFLTRIIRIANGYIKKNNDRIILKAWKDYKIGKFGKVSL